MKSSQRREVQPMFSNRTQPPLVLLIDDTVCEESGNGFDKSDFLAVVGSDLARFEFSTAFDTFEDAYTSLEALEFVERMKEKHGSDPDAIFIDIMFGKPADARELGFEIMAEISKNWPKIPIVAMSSERPDTILVAGTEPLSRRTASYGAVTFLKKPFSKLQFKNALDIALKHDQGAD
jgi:CheY-like chemotaxis protein